MAAVSDAVLAVLISPLQLLLAEVPHPHNLTATEMEAAAK